MSGLLSRGRQCPRFRHCQKLRTDATAGRPGRLRNADCGACPQSAPSGRGGRMSGLLSRGRQCPRFRHCQKLRTDATAGRPGRLRNADCGACPQSAPSGRGAGCRDSCPGGANARVSAIVRSDLLMRGLAFLATPQRPSRQRVEAGTGHPWPAPARPSRRMSAKGSIRPRGPDVGTPVLGGLRPTVGCAVDLFIAPALGAEHRKRRIAGACFWCAAARLA